jgi:crotonobetainyl-CoA:carnitine CoA-transferase CaiB-like acyl-CoA transferase
MVIELRHPSGATTRGPGNPIKLSRTGEEAFSPAPLLGEHTDTVFSELLGYSAEEIGGLRERGVIG